MYAENVNRTNPKQKLKVVIVGLTETQVSNVQEVMHIPCKDLPNRPDLPCKSASLRNPDWFAFLMRSRTRRIP